MHSRSASNSTFKLSVKYEVLSCNCMADLDLYPQAKEILDDLKKSFIYRPANKKNYRMPISRNRAKHEYHVIAGKIVEIIMRLIPQEDHEIYQYIENDVITAVIQSISGCFDVVKELVELDYLTIMTYIQYNKTGIVVNIEGEFTCWNLPCIDKEVQCDDLKPRALKTHTCKFDIPLQKTDALSGEEIRMIQERTLLEFEKTSSQRSLRSLFCSHIESAFQAYIDKQEAKPLSLVQKEVTRYLLSAPSYVERFVVLYKDLPVQLQHNQETVQSPMPSCILLTDKEQPDKILDDLEKSFIRRPANDKSYLMPISRNRAKHEYHVIAGKIVEIIMKLITQEDHEIYRDIENNIITAVIESIKGVIQSIRGCSDIVKKLAQLDYLEISVYIEYNETGIAVNIKSELIPSNPPTTYIEQAEELNDLKTSAYAYKFNIALKKDDVPPQELMIFFQKMALSKKYTRRPDRRPKQRSHAFSDHKAFQHLAQGIALRALAIIPIEDNPSSDPRIESTTTRILDKTLETLVVQAALKSTSEAHGRLNPHSIFLSSMPNTISLAKAQTYVPQRLISPTPIYPLDSTSLVKILAKVRPLAPAARESASPIQIQYNQGKYVIYFPNVCPIIVVSPTQTSPNAALLVRMLAKVITPHTPAQEITSPIVIKCNQNKFIIYILNASADSLAQMSTKAIKPAPAK